MSEHIIPNDYDELVSWFNLIRRVNSVIVSGSIQWVTVGVLIDSSGKPIGWTAAERYTLEPKGREVEIKD